MKKILFLLLLPFLGEIIVSCCDCSDPIRVEFNYTGVDLQLFGNGELIENGDTLSLSDTSIHFEVELQAKKVGVQIACKTQAWFIQSAAAYSCLCEDEVLFLIGSAIENLTLYADDSLSQRVNAYDDLFQEMRFSVGMEDYYPGSYSYINTLNHKANFDGDNTFQNDPIVFESFQASIGNALLPGAHKLFITMENEKNEQFTDSLQFVVVE